MNRSTVTGTSLVGVALLTLALLILFVSCEDDAQVASRNVSKAADNFEVDRRVVFYDSINAEYMLSIEGKCSIEDQVNQLEVICKIGFSQETGDPLFKKHFLGLSDNVTYFAEQVEPVTASEYHYRVTFKPQLIVPDIDLRGGDPNFSE